MVEREGRWVSRERSQCCRRQRGRSCTAPTSASLRLWERLEGGGRTGDVDVDVDVETERRRRRGAVEGCSLAHTLSSKCMQDRETVGVGGGGRRRQRRDRDYLPEPRVQRHAIAAAALLQATNATLLTATTKTHTPNSSSIALSASQSIIIELVSCCSLLIYAVASSLRRGSRDRHLSHHSERAVRGGTTGTKCLAIPTVISTSTRLVVGDLAIACCEPPRTPVQ